MRIKRERKFFHGILYAFFPLFLSILVTSCKQDATDSTVTKLVGTWHQISRTTDGNLSVKDSTRLLIQINSNQICILCDSSALAITANTIISRSGWSYTGGVFNLAVDLPSSWVPTFDADFLSLEKTGFKKDGTISKTILKFERVSNIEFN